MKRKWNQRTMALAAAALVLTAGVMTNRTLAYFTTYVTASGGHELELGFTTTIPEEEVANWTKDISITNTGGNPCYVRVKAFAGVQFELEYDLAASDSRWSALGTDGYYYWQEILKPGETTGSLLVRIDKKDAKEDFNVIIVQECTPVPYDENGVPAAWDQVDWTRTADVVKTETSETVNSGEDKE